MPVSLDLFLVTNNNELLGIIFCLFITNHRLGGIATNSKSQVRFLFIDISGGHLVVFSLSVYSGMSLSAASVLTVKAQFLLC